MHFELTEQQRLKAQNGEPVEVIDPQTQERYVLIAGQWYTPSAPMPIPPAAREEPPLPEIPEGIRISQEAYRRELPELLKQKKIFRWWVAYHRDERIGIAYDGDTLLRDCLKRGLADDEYFVGWIDASGLEVEEDIGPMRLHHFEGFDDEDS